MLVEIEISDQDIKNYVEEYIKKNFQQRYSSFNMKIFLEERTKEALCRAFNETDFMQIIERDCRKVALEEIEKAARQKTPGWVRQQMKEMLKYARTKFWESQPAE